MRVQDAARLIGVSADLIRKLERRGLIALPRDHNGHRRLTPEHVEQVRRVVFPERRRDTHVVLTRKTAVAPEPAV